MKRSTLSRYILFILVIVLGGCWTAAPQPSLKTTLDSPNQAINTPSTEALHVVVNTPSLTVSASALDSAAAEDIASSIQAHQDQICSQLQITCQFPISIEIYPSQASFDDHAMNPELRGYYAISGKRTIQMVSPRVQPAQRSISYDERVLIAVHEYVHLVLNEINLDLPAWLAEGTSVYLGPHNLYDLACSEGLPLNRIPHLQVLMASYASVPGADFFAYTIARYIVETDGLEALNQLIRAPADIKGVLNRTLPELEGGWLDFLKSTCAP